MKIKKKEKRKTSRFQSIVSGILIVVLGLVVLNYPSISDAWNTMLSDRLVSIYQDDSSKTEQDMLMREFEKARQYNDEKLVNSPMDPFSSLVPADSEYEKCLNISGNGIMGYLEIPTIHQRIVIYHGTLEEALRKGCGHVMGTSLPVGGKGSHCVIAGHRGMPNAKLFTDLDQMESGDIFYLFILNQTLAYEVDQIKVVLPDDIDDLQIIGDKDLVTLVTCTPYGVNTHRLLIRGHRVKYVSKTETTTIADTLKSWQIKLILAVITLVIVVFVKRYVDRRKRNMISTED